MVFSSVLLPFRWSWFRHTDGGLYLVLCTLAAALRFVAVCRRAVVAHRQRLQTFLLVCLRLLITPSRQRLPLWRQSVPSASGRGTH